jgi:predicted ATPase
MNKKVLEILEVENVGPIEKARVETKKVNVFIGANSTGKSVIAKLLQVKRENENKENYNLEEFIFKNSKINYKTENFKQKFTIWDEFLESLKKDMSLDFLKNDKIKEELSKLDLKTILEDLLSKKYSYYVPVERNLVPFFSSYGVNLLSSRIPLPQYVLEFATEFRLAKDKIKSIDILNVNYKFENEEDRIYINKEKYVSLKSASSGIQTLLPIYLTIEYLNLTSKKHYILEEPELNIFPEEQFELVKYMIKNSESVIFITHSPYVLFSLNILLYAYEVGNMNKEAKKLVEEIVPSDYWINPEEFSAYYFENGKIKNFFDGLIEDNVLDGVSTELEDIFDELQDIYIKVKK